MPRNLPTVDYAIANHPLYGVFETLSTSKPTIERRSRLNSTPIKPRSSDERSVIGDHAVCQAFGRLHYR